MFGVLRTKSAVRLLLCIGGFLCAEAPLGYPAAGSDAVPRGSALLQLLHGIVPDHLLVLPRTGSRPLLSMERGVEAPVRYVALTPINLKAGIYALPDGDLVLAPLQRKKPTSSAASGGHSFQTGVRTQSDAPFDQRTGAIHGIRSKNGYSAEVVAVYAPCGARHMLALPDHLGVLHDSELGFIYIGGWGAGPDGTAVDAGFQASSAQSPSGDDYAFYWKYDRNGPVTYARTLRFACGHSIRLSMYPITDTLLYYTATGIDHAGHTLVLGILQVTNTADGWWPNGGSSTDGIILKRMVTIAQPPTWHEKGPDYRSDAFTHSAWFGINGTTPVIQWRDCRIGHYPAVLGNLPSWTAAQTYKTSNVNSPDGAVQTVNTPGVCDTVGIDLDKTTP